MADRILPHSLLLITMSLYLYASVIAKLAIFKLASAVALRDIFAQRAVDPSLITLTFGSAGFKPVDQISIKAQG